MNAIAEALGLSLPGCASIPAPYRSARRSPTRPACASVEIVLDDIKPLDILTRKAFENAIVACSAIGGSTNAPIHLNAIARHAGVKLSIEDWETYRLRRAAAGQHAAGRAVSRRGLSPRRRPAGGPQRTPQGQAPARRRDDRQRQDHRRERQARRDRGPRRDPSLRQAADGARRLQGAQGQPVRLRDHEDQRDLRRVPQALSLRSEGSGCVRGPRRRVRRAGGLSPPHRRSRAQDRRAHDPVHARRRRRSAIRARPRS